MKSLVVITAGFAEIGDAGRALQQQLVERVRNFGMRMVGPNCMGLLNASPEVSLNASFSPVMPPPGSVGFSSQSGALGLAILELARQRGVGLSTFISVGNKADVSGNDLLQVPGRATRPRASSCCISNRSGTRAALPGSRGASRGSSRSSP